VAASDLRSLATALLALLVLVFPPLALADSSSPAPTPLGAGQRGSYSWSVKASRLVGSRPCVSVAIIHRHGPFSYDGSRFHECATASPGLTRSTPPLLVGGIHLGGDGSRMTVYGILASAGTRTVRATLADGLEAARVSARLTPVALRADRAGDLRFAVIVLPGRHCVERLAAVGPHGKALWQGVPTDHACA
jgi:hypothetical protein